MRILFVHQNFPAQFRCVAPRLAADYGWDCTFVTENHVFPDIRGVKRVLYRRLAASNTPTVLLSRFQNTVSHSLGIYQTLKQRPDVQPDLVVAHSGFGSSLFLPQLYDAPVINFFETFYRPVGQDLGYRPELAVTEAKILASRTNNAMILFDLENCDRGWCPNHAQRDAFPKEFHSKIEVMPEGIDTELYRRLPAVSRTLPDGTPIDEDTRIVTYVSRGLELQRGFDVFMRVAKRVYERFPKVKFIVVGRDKPYYGCDRQVTGGKSLRQHLVDSGEFDMGRFHFTGYLPEPKLVEILSLSDLHFYLTVPFITSWSLLDAMACGCVVLASDQACVREYVRHGENGLLGDFFDVERLADQAIEALKYPKVRRRLGEAARRTIVDQYSVVACLPRLKTFFKKVAATKRSPSAVAQSLIRSGTGLPLQKQPPAKEPPRPAPPPFEGTLPFGFGVAPATLAAAPGKSGEPKTILFAWELGGGLGHMLPMLPLAQDLVAAGHRVFMALRELSRATQIFGQVGVRFLQAPYKPSSRGRFARTHNMAHILANNGWGEAFELFGYACAWRNLIEFVQPNLIVCDHSPTALLAARACPDARCATTGLGFFCPPDISPFPQLTAGVIDAQRLEADERQVLDHANRVLTQWRRPVMDRLGQLYGEVDDTFLTTFPELDHYTTRPQGAAYWGSSHSPGGKAPEWPKGRGRRVYAYLKPFPALPALLTALAEGGHRTIVFADGIDAATRKRFASDSIGFVDERLDLERVGRECDVAIHNANHGTLCQLLLAGKPMLQVPITLEQTMLARAVEGTGAAVTASAKSTSVEEFQAKLTDLLENTTYADAAARFAHRYEAFDASKQRRAMLNRVAELLLAERNHRPNPIFLSSLSPTRRTSFSQLDELATV